MRNWRGGGVLIGKIAFEVGEDIEEGGVSEWCMYIWGGVTCSLVLHVYTRHA